MSLLNKPEGFRVVEKDGIKYAAGLYFGENLGNMQPTYGSFKTRTPAGNVINMSASVPLTTLDERLKIFDAIHKVAQAEQPELTNVLSADGFWDDNISAAVSAARPEVGNKIVAFYSAEKAKELQ